MLAVGGAVLTLALAVVVAGLSSESVATQAVREQGHSQCTQLAQGVERSVAAPAPDGCMQPRRVVLNEQDAIAGASSTTSLPQQVLAARARAKFQPHTQSAIRLIRERQDAIITAFSHRMRDASEPGSASHSADRPLIVTRPLRGPPSRA
ncbi:hypothetical protein [Hyalangium versicolor]|uniref:hypothetical protein n=1 Tax=Hyalangium versicolor TaxID=2861190 RepID=UPI001CCE584E|nr:hypothetical protein [Hyalangium versicolor]